METLLLFVAEFAVSAQHDLQMAREVFFAEQSGYTRDAFSFFTRNLEEGRVLPGDFRDRGIAQEADHLTREVRGTVALADQVVDLAKHFVARATCHGLHDFFENMCGRGTNQVAHGVGCESSA